MSAIAKGRVKNSKQHVQGASCGRKAGRWAMFVWEEGKICDNDGGISGASDTAQSASEANDCNIRICFHREDAAPVDRCLKSAFWGSIEF